MISDNVALFVWSGLVVTGMICGTLVEIFGAHCQ